MNTTTPATTTATAATTTTTVASKASPEKIFESIIDENGFTGTVFSICNVINNILVILITIIIGTKCWRLHFTRTALHAYFCTLGVSGQEIKYERRT